MLMKDGLGEPAIHRIAKVLAVLIDDFSVSCFSHDALNGLDELELKERVQHVIGVLHKFLPARFSEAAKILAGLPGVWDRGDPDDSLSGFAAWPIIDYVAVYGVDAPKTALPLLAELTPLFTSEFAIRAFIESHQKLTFEYLHEWVTHKNEHVRRLVSEGTRPRLPWGGQLKAFIESPEPCLPLLENLRNDDSEYVRRSVANHLNDIGKDHPALLVEICKRWKAQDQDDVVNKKKSDWVISHATRSLVKSGYPKVFSLLGYCESPKLTLAKFELNEQQVKIGSALSFLVELVSAKENQKFVLDYAVHYRKANGKCSPKVFKLKNVTLRAGERLSLEKTISFKLITTRKFYSGMHCVALHVNGVEIARREFELIS
ncbi:MAG: hypothetical protein K6L76_11520 [Agarilytica sp.]